jgi:hypothetical protein
MQRLVVLVLTLGAGCANNNVAELAGRVRVVDDPALAQTCRWVGRVSGGAMTLTGARQQAQRRALFLGGNLIVTGAKGRQGPRASVGNRYPSAYEYRGSINGLAYDCASEGSLWQALTGVTFIAPNQITVAPETPEGCDALGPPVEAFSDGRPGSAEDGLRRMAGLIDANYVRVLKTVDYDGRPALRGQPYACALQLTRPGG